MTANCKSHLVAICFWINFINFTLSNAQSYVVQQHINTKDANGLQNFTVSTNAPNMDYNNEWRPVGRGDPLQNDPTFDYSPPALERVRYWAENNEKSGEKKDAITVETRKNNANANVNASASRKKETIYSAVAKERIRAHKQSAANIVHNYKVDTPILQPKYTSIRRSYYAHQLPTRLMPPPMQTVAPQNMMNVMSHEYRNRAHDQMTGTTSAAMPISSTHYASMSSAPWMQTSSSITTPHHALSMPTTYSTHHQDSANYFSYTHTLKPQSFSPNAIRSPHNVYKHNTALRKPWVHELLQKEVVKTAHSTSSQMQYSKGTARPAHSYMSTAGISTTYAPVHYATTTTMKPPPTMYSTSAIYITPTTPTSTTAQSPPAPVLTSTRLLIPDTSNLSYRPTVAPVEVTTDALFSHYNQPDKALYGPMYLIIEGHSKVKTYGQNELDPHQPKIVPITPKREPIIKRVDPNEQRGTIETFQVKHLHTKTTIPDGIRTTNTILLSARPVSHENTSTATSIAEIKKSMKSTNVETLENKQNLIDLPNSALDSSLRNNSSKTPATKLELVQDSKIFETTTAAERPTLQQNEQNSANALILDIDSDDNRSVLDSSTTEPLPRETRQIYDYDQLPESRFKERIDVGPVEYTDTMEDDLWSKPAYDDDIDVDDVEYSDF